MYEARSAIAAGSAAERRSGEAGPSPLQRTGRRLPEHLWAPIIDQAEAGNEPEAAESCDEIWHWSCAWWRRQPLQNCVSSIDSDERRGRGRRWKTGFRRRIRSWSMSVWWRSWKPLWRTSARSSVEEAAAHLAHDPGRRAWPSPLGSAGSTARMASASIPQVTPGMGTCGMTRRCSTHARRDLPFMPSLCYHSAYAPVPQLDRGPVYETDCCGFESRRARQPAPGPPHVEGPGLCGPARARGLRCLEIGRARDGPAYRLHRLLALDLDFLRLQCLRLGQGQRQHTILECRFRLVRVHRHVERQCP